MQNDPEYKFDLNSIDKIAKSMKKMSSVESALTLRELYNLGYFLMPPYISGNEPSLDDLFGNIMYKDMEDTNDFLRMNVIVGEYIQYDMHKVLGITVQQYLDTTPLERLFYLKACKSYQEKMTQAMNDATNNIEKRNKNALSSLSNIGGNLADELE